MKKIFYILAFLISVSIVSAQTPTPELTRFNGGSMNLDISFASNFFGGGGLAGGIISPTMNNHSSAVFGNPAELSFLKNPYAHVDYRLGIGTTGFVASDMISSPTDDYLKDTTMFIYNLEHTNYTNVNSSSFSQTGGFSSFSVAFPIDNRFVFAFGYNYPMLFNMELGVNGIETELKTAQDLGGNETTFDMVLNTTVNASTKLNINEIVLGLGANIFNNENGYLSAGLSLSRKYVLNSFDWLVKIDGAIILNHTNEYFFNDPSDPLIESSNGESNNFYWQLKGNYTDTKYGGKIGLYYNFDKDKKSVWNLSLVYDLEPNFTLSDPNSFSESYQPKFITGRIMGVDDEAINIQLDSMDISKPHLTVNKKNVFTQNVNLEMPSSLTFGIDASLTSGTSFAFNLIKYFGDFSYRYDKYKFGKATGVGLKFAGNFHLDDELEGWGIAFIPVRLLFLDFDGLLFQLFRSSTHYTNSFYRVGFGLVFGDSIAEGFDEDYTSSLDALGMPFPYGIALSKSYTVFDNVNVGVMVFSVPDLALKLSLGYGL
jgi:hypothetical protein